MGDIEKAIKAYTRNPKVKENICDHIQQEKYIQAMIEIFHTAEEQEDLDNLHALFTCLQTISLSCVCPPQCNADRICSPAQ